MSKIRFIRSLASRIFQPWFSHRAVERLRGVRVYRLERRAGPRVGLESFELPGDDLRLQRGLLRDQPRPLLIRADLSNTVTNSDSSLKSYEFNLLHLISGAFRITNEN